MVEIEISDRQPDRSVDTRPLRRAVRQVLEGEGIGRALISLALVDDAEMRHLNRTWLGHDWPTDVLSFCLEQAEGHVEGQIVVSVETAAAAAPRYGWAPSDELLLYVIHGALHLAGHDDGEPNQAALMRARERHYLAPFGLTPQSRPASQRLELSCPSEAPA